MEEKTKSEILKELSKIVCLDICGETDYEICKECRYCVLINRIYKEE